MMTFENIKSLIHQCRLEDAEKELNRATDTAMISDSQRLYLMGLVFSKRADWASAKSAFLQACELDAESPAAEAMGMLTDIYDFYYKDNLNP